MVEENRDAAIAQLNHALGTLTPAVDTATVRHHIDYVKTRLTQYINRAEAVFEIKDNQLIAKQNEIKTMEKRIHDLEEENRSLREKHNSPPPPPHEENNWEEEETIEELREENQQLRLKMLSLEELISQCEPSIRDYLRGRNGQASEDEENDCEDAPKTIEQLREENQQLRLNMQSLEDRISGCEPCVRDFLFG